MLTTKTKSPRFGISLDGYLTSGTPTKGNIMTPTQHATTIFVSRTIKKQGEAEVADGGSETLEVHQFATTPAVVSVSYPIKLTKNYQAAGIDVGISLPCYAEEIDDAFQRANDLVIERLKVELPKLKQLLNQMAEGR